MDPVEQLKQKVSRLLMQFVQGQTEPSAESLEIYQITQEQFREGLLLLQEDVVRKKQQQEVQTLADASDNEAAKDKVGVSCEEDAKKPEAGTGRAEEIASDQREEAAKKVLAGEKSMATLHDLYVLKRQKEDEMHNVCHYITRAANAASVLLNIEEIHSYMPAYRIAELCRLLGMNASECV